MNVFYDHLVNIQELHIELDLAGVPVNDRADLISLIDSTVHHEIFDLIMVELPRAHQQFFLEILSADPSDPKILQFLRELIPGIEDKIKLRGEQIKKDTISRIRKLQ